MYKFAHGLHKVLGYFEWSHNIGKLRILALKEEIWDKQRMKLCKSITSSKNEKHQKLWQQIAKIDPLVKDFMIEAYNYRMKIFNKIEFLKWYIDDQDYLHKQQEDSPTFLFEPKYYSYKRKIDDFSLHLKDIDEFMIRHVEKYSFAYQSHLKFMGKEGKKN